MRPLRSLAAFSIGVFALLGVLLSSCDGSRSASGAAAGVDLHARIMAS